VRAPPRLVNSSERARGRIERLVEDLALLLGHPGWVGPEHPRFKRWLSEARWYVRTRASEGERKRFEALGFVRARPTLWKREEDTPGELRSFRADLERARELFEEIQGARGSSAKITWRFPMGVPLPFGWARRP
jgi:hypothetical protein